MVAAPTRIRFAPGRTWRNAAHATLAIAMGSASTHAAPDPVLSAPGARLTLPEAIGIAGGRREPLVLEIRPGPENPGTVWAWHPFAPHQYHPLRIERIAREEGAPVLIEASGELEAVPPWIGGATVRVSYSVETDTGEAVRAYRVAIAPHATPAETVSLLADTTTSLPHVARRGIAYNAWKQVPRVATLELRPARPAPSRPRLPELRKGDPLPASGDAWLDQCRETAVLALRALTGESGHGPTLMRALDALADDPPLPTAPKSATAPPAAYDLRTAIAAATRGLAALALPESPETTAAKERAALGVRRFLETGIGDRGCGTGQIGAGIAWEVLTPFLAAWASVTGEDLAAGTGAAWAGLWIATENPQPDLATFPALLALADPAVRSALAPAWEQAGRPAAGPLQGWCAAWVRAHPGSGQPQPLPRVVEDRRMQAYLFSEGDRRFRFLAGGSPAPAIAPCGQFLLATGSTGWARPARDLPPFAWPDPAHWNVVQVLKSESTARGSAAWTGPGERSRVEVRADGSASFGMRGGPFREADADAPNGGELEESHHWRTVGIDTSGRSGAGTALVFVEGNDGLRDRQQAWQMAVGDWPEGSVRIGDRRFEVRLPGEKRVLAGAVLYPVSAHIAYEPNHPGGGRLRIYRWPPGTRAPEALENAMDRLEKDLGTFLGRAGGAEPERDLREFRLEEETDPTRSKAGLERLQQLYFLKLLRETSSVKMGAGDRAPRARDSWVVALTISDGEPPPIRPAVDENGPLLWIGPQAVRYDEHRIRFGEEP